MDESCNYHKMVERAFYKVMKNKEFIAEWPKISVLPNVSKNGEIEIERRILKIFHTMLTKLMNEQKVPKGMLSAGKLKGTGGDFYANLLITSGLETDFQTIGKVFYKIVDLEEDLELIFRIHVEERSPIVIHTDLSEKLPYLSVAPCQTPIVDIFNPEPRLVLVDFEWINYFKSSQTSKNTSPEQVSEYAIMTDDDVYDSGYLKVDSAIVKKIHQKLLEKQGVTKEMLLERHKHGVTGATMYDEFEHNILPLLGRSIEEGKPLIFIYFGREDGVILQQLFTEEQCKSIQFVDFTQLYAIVQLGQSSILKGLGVRFLHTFDAVMDVKALRLIIEVFRVAKTEEDSRNLQNAILVKKMIYGSQNPQRVEKYQKLIMNHPRTLELFEQALDVVEQYEKDGYFEGLLSDFLWE